MHLRTDVSWRKQLSHGLVGGEKDKFYEDLEVRPRSRMPARKSRFGQLESRVLPIVARLLHVERRWSRRFR